MQNAYQIYTVVVLKKATCNHHKMATILNVFCTRGQYKASCQYNRVGNEDGPVVNSLILVAPKGNLVKPLYIYIY